MAKKKYTKVKELGKGGNGIVYLVKDENNNLFAKKILMNIKNKKRYLRFQDEVNVLYRLQNQNGIVPIIDHYYPSQLSTNRYPYYIMPLCVTLKEYIKTISLENKFLLLFDVCKTISYLHSLDITHRDIKPDNILVLNGKAVIADFGLANFPRKKRISSLNEKIGPRWTIAPEMERISSTAEYKKADIYSLAKTIWMIITEQWNSFEGQYIPYSNISIENYVKVYINEPHIAGEWLYFSLVLLDRLLVQATDNNPNKRPNIDEFIDKFEYWFYSNDSFKERNPYEWEDALHRIFPVSIPISSSWVDIYDILNVLTIIFHNYDNLNHSFYPDGGGDDFKKIYVTENGEYLVINGNILIKPKVLHFESLNDLNWSYFRLEVEPLDPIYPENIYHSEEIVFLNNDFQQSQNKADGFAEYSKYLQGSFVITKKTSIINILQGKFNAYSGFHNTMTNKDYKSALLNIKSQIEKSQKKQ